MEQYDSLVHWRCRQLGGEVTFRYCRRLLEGLPCSRVVACWHSEFDVGAFLQSHYDPDQLKAAWNQPAPEKLVQLSELVKRATGE